MPHLALMACCVLQSRAADFVEGGNAFYRVVINKAAPFSSGRPMDGFYAALTGPEHPVTRDLGLQGELLGLRRDCGTCAGASDITFSVVRSYTSRTDFTLGKNPNGAFFILPEPGFTCINATAVVAPVVESLLDAGEPTGVHAIWFLDMGDESLDIEEILRAHGEDFAGSSVEMSLRVRNAGTSVIRIGLRHVWPIRISGPIDPLTGLPRRPVSGGFVGVRPPDPPLEPFTEVETEWLDPSFRMWQVHGGSPYPSVDPIRYSVACAVAGPASLEPPPTPPNLVQQAAEAKDPGIEGPGLGAAAACFEWHPPVPPRRIADIKQMSMTSYWGLDEDDAFELEPGAEVTVTQHLVAFIEYPVAAATDGPYEEPCQGAVTRVSIDGRAELAEPTTAQVHYRWRSADPRVTFIDDAAPSTEAEVAGVGAFPVELTVAVGAYEASTATTITVTDDTPPSVADLRVDPSVLWPPNHRMVEVCVGGAVTDSCDPAPSLRLVGVTSSEPDDANGIGDGRFTGDIAEAEVGLDDRCVMLRAERAGTRRGRTYVLTYEAEDWAGNVSSAQLEVLVPHDARSRSPAHPGAGGRGSRS
jgi:hypothetical protein